MVNIARVTILGVLFAALGYAQAPDKWVGTWKLNVAKSSYQPASAPQSSTSKIEAAPGGIKVVSDTVNAAGATSHSEFTAKYGGEEAPVTGAAPGATASVTRIDANTFEVITKAQGATTVARNVISADGKTRTATQILTIGGKEQGKLMLVYDKQP